MTPLQKETPVLGPASRVTDRGLSHHVTVDYWGSQYRVGGHVYVEPGAYSYKCVPPTFVLPPDTRDVRLIALYSTLVDFTLYIINYYYYY